MNVFSLSNNSFYVRGTPWITSSFADDYKIRVYCEECGRKRRIPIVLIKLYAEKSKGSFWPDLLGCGDLVGLYISEQVKNDWDTHGITYDYACPAEVQKPYPKRMENLVPPRYYYMILNVGIKMDLTASGYKVLKRCSKCGDCKLDVHQEPLGYHFVEGSWNGTHLFFADNGGAYFCTDKIIELARQYRRTNFRFVPAEEPEPAAHKGLKYL